MRKVVSILIFIMPLVFIYVAFCVSTYFEKDTSNMSTSSLWMLSIILISVSYRSVKGALELNKYWNGKK